MSDSSATTTPEAQVPADATGAKRIALLDALRGLALVAMAVYHFVWDLEFFGYVAAGTAGTGGWRMFARLIASSFLFLAGYSSCSDNIRNSVRAPSPCVSRKSRAPPR